MFGEQETRGQEKIGSLKKVGKIVVLLREVIDKRIDNWDRPCEAPNKLFSTHVWWCQSAELTVWKAQRRLIGRFPEQRDPQE